MLRRAVRGVGHHDRRGRRRRRRARGRHPRHRLAHGAEIRDHVRRIAAGRPVRWVVNTHEHFDHILGNVASSQQAGHPRSRGRRRVDGRLPSSGSATRSRADPSHDPDDPAITARCSRTCWRRAGPAARRDLRVGRARSTSATGYVELVHPGRGHTAGDLVVRVPDADVVYAGDLVEESAPPAFGVRLLPAGVAGDPRPHRRAAHRRDRRGARGTAAASTATSSTGSGPMSPTVAETIRSLYRTGGCPLDRALDAGGDCLGVPGRQLTWRRRRRGYEHLARAPASSQGRTPAPHRHRPPDASTRLSPARHLWTALRHDLSAAAGSVASHVLRPLRHRRPRHRLARAEAGPVGRDPRPISGWSSRRSPPTGAARSSASTATSTPSSSRTAAASGAPSRSARASSSRERR